MPARPLERTLNAPAYRADGRDCSREAFYALACDPARSVVVQACAGAGKTWMLVSRILRALLDGAQPHEVLAITFTRKAAGEMRQRLDEWLLDFSDRRDHAGRVQELCARGLSPPQAEAAAPRLAGLRAQVLAAGRGVQVQTFHAWFAQLMRAAPIERLQSLGLQPGMTLLEDAADWWPTLMARWRRQVLADAGLLRDYAALVSRHGRSRVKDWLLLALSRQVELELADEAGALADSVLPAAALDPRLAGLERPEQRLLADALLRARMDQAARALGALSGKQAQEAAQGLRDALLARDAEAAYDLARLALFTKEGHPRKLSRDALPIVQPLQDELAALADLVAQQRAHEDHGAMLGLSRALLAQWRALKQQQGLADMNDLERVAQAVLGDPALSGWVLQRLDAQVRHLLIDEFQDTSPLQWHALLGWLGGYAGAGGGASGQRPPSVFIVGDPKQSIYRFRRAEPKVFDAALDFVVQGLGGVALACDHTRRNAPGLVQALNQVFEAAAQGGESIGFRAHSTEVAEGGQVRALPLVPREPATRTARDAKPALVWRDGLTTPRRTERDNNAMQEARQVAQAVQALMREQGLAPGQVMLLARRRSTLGLAAQALRERHVPCVAAEDLRLADQPEVADLVALLDLLASPGHDLSLARALRSPVFGASDDELVALSQRARAAGSPWWAALAAWADAPPCLARARELLAAWSDAARVLPPHDLLDRILDQGEVLPRLLAAAPVARRALADLGLRALLQQALGLDGARYATPYNFVRALKKRALKMKVPARHDAVQLLTVHGAKGLEADAVFLLDMLPQRPQDHDPSLLVDWPVHSPRPRRAAFLSHASRCPPSLQALDLAEQAESAREELNGLYVSMTRARRWLVLSAHQPHQPAPGTAWWTRLQAVSTPWALPPDATQAAAEDAAKPVAAAAVAIAVAESSVSVPMLPRLPQGWIVPARPDAAADRPERADLGSAVHRLLEWATRPGAGMPRADLARAAAAACGLAPDQAGAVLAAAERVLDSPAFARFIDPEQLLWAGNEVPLSDAGDNLRLDRLVRLHTPQGPQWWVLDYKLALQPQAQPAYQAQMGRYLRALQAMLPGEVVRAALVAGDGQVLEVAPPGPG